MDPTHIASTYTSESTIQNLGSSSSNTPNENAFSRIGAVVKNLARIISCSKRIQYNNQLATQNQNRNLHACSDTVAKAIEVLIGSDATGSPHSMLLSPADIHSTVKAFSGYLGHGPALSRLHLAIQQPYGSHEPPTLAELHNSLTTLGNNSTERAHDIARASLGDLVKNIPQRRTPFFTTAYTKILKTQGPSALLLLKTLNEEPTDGDSIGTYTNLTVGELKRLSRMLHDFVKTLPIDTQQRLDALEFVRHIEGKITTIRAILMFESTNRHSLDTTVPILCTDMDVMKNVVRVHGFFLHFASPALRNNQDLVMIAVQQYGIALEFASESLQGNPSVVMAAVQNEGSALQYASHALKNNRDIVMAAVRQYGNAIWYASRELQNDPEVLAAAAQQNGRPILFPTAPPAEDLGL